MKNIICLVLVLFTLLSFSQNDSLRIVWQGDYKCEKYKFFFKDSCYGIIKPKFKRFYISFPLDSSIKKDYPIPIKIYKKSLLRLYFRDTYFYAFFDSEKRYLIIHRNNRLKSRYAIESIWSDELVRYR